MNFSLLEKAIAIATEAHKGQKDKSGSPYILHLIRVMQNGATLQEQIAGVLHDLIEDTNWTYEMLENNGFPTEVIEAIRCVTKIDGEGYNDFIQRISKNKLAIKVKLNDLEDNMDIKRLKEITTKDAERLTKYLRAYNYLKGYVVND